MSFLHPAIAAAAVASIALPIVIHLLFRRRRVPIEWAAMELLRAAVKRTNRRLRLEQWIVLALRSLAVLAAGLAVAAPFLGESLSTGLGRSLTVVVVDDGATSGLRVGEESELERIRGEVAAIVASGSARDVFALVRAGSPATLALAPTEDRARIDEVLQRIEPTETPSDLASALGIARSLIEGEGAGSARFERSEILVASGFRRASVPERIRAGVESGKEGVPEETTPVSITALVPAAENPVDVRIRQIDARPAPTGDAVTVRALVARIGGSLDRAETRVRAGGDGFGAGATRVVSWEPGQADATVEFTLPTEAAESASRRRGIEVSVEGDALAPGNRGFTVIEMKREIEVAIVGRRGTIEVADIERVPASLWIARALAPGGSSGLRVREIDPSSCDASALAGIDACVVTRPDLLSSSAVSALSGFVRSGRVVVLAPSGDSRSQAWAASVLPALGVASRLAAEATDAPTPLQLAEEQPQSALLSSLRPEMSGLVGPIEVSRVATIDGHARGDAVLVFTDGSPFMVAESPKSDGERGAGSGGLVVLFAAAPELSWTNLPIKPLMVPLLQESVRAGMQLAAGAASTFVGERMVAQPAMSFKDGSGGSLAIDESGLSREPVLKAGLWRGDDGSIVAANVAEPSIDVTPMGEESVRAAFSGLGAISFARTGSELAQTEARGRAGIAPWLFALALLALLAEGILSRIFSHAARRGDSDGAAAVATIGRIQRRARPQSDRTPAAGAIR